MTRAHLCPECSSTISLWAAKFAWFSGGKIVCPRCRTLLAFECNRSRYLLSLFAFVGAFIAADLGAGRLTSNAWLRPLVDGAILLVLIGIISFISARYMTTHVPLNRKVQNGPHA